MTEIETDDHLVVGAGAGKMAFVDSLIAVSVGLASPTLPPALIGW